MKREAMDRIAENVAEQEMAVMMQNTFPIVRVCMMDGKVIAGVEADRLVASLNPGDSINVLQNVQVAIQRVIDGVRYSQKAEMRKPQEGSRKAGVARARGNLDLIFEPGDVNRRTEAMLDKLVPDWSYLEANVAWDGWKEKGPETGGMVEVEVNSFDVDDAVLVGQDGSEMPLKGQSLRVLERDDRVSEKVLEEAV